MKTPYQRIKTREQLEYKSLTIKQWLKIERSNKDYVVIIKDKLYFTKDDKNLDRLIFERLSYKIASNVEIYSLKY